MEKLILKDIIEKISEYEILSGSDKLDNQINKYGLSRAGLELTGYFDPIAHEKRLILMSTKESNYISEFNKEDRIKKYQKLIEYNAPGIIITEKFKDEETLCKIAKKYDYPLIKCPNITTTLLIKKILNIYDFYFSEATEIHASLINIFGKGVLIKGESGIGKSEVVLELIKNNHLFVGDDRIHISNIDNNIIGKSHPIIKNLIEVRGLGILDVSQIYGVQSLLEQCNVDLVIELVNYSNKNLNIDFDRLGNELQTTEILGVKIPHIVLPVSAGRNIKNIIETAVAKVKLDQSNKYPNILDVLDKRRDEN